jgi:putative transposase
MASLLSFRLRSRASLELEVIALRHQLSVLKRQRPGRARLFYAYRLLWISLSRMLRGNQDENSPRLTRYTRIWPQAINAMVLVKPTTVLQWHHRGFRLVWRYRSGARKPGRPQTTSEVRDLIRQTSTANPLWGAPRIHGELLKLGIEVSQATVGRNMPWRPKDPSPLGAASCKTI